MPDTEFRYQVVNGCSAIPKGMSDLENFANTRGFSFKSGNTKGNA